MNSGILITIGLCLLVSWPRIISSIHVHVSFLPALRGGKGFRYPGAFLVAMQEISNDSYMLRDVNITYSVTDILADTRTSVQAMTEQYDKGVSVFIGPEGTCATESIVAASWNIPMLSYVSLTVDLLTVS